MSSADIIPSIPSMPAMSSMPSMPGMSSGWPQAWSHELISSISGPCAAWIAVARAWISGLAPAVGASARAAISTACWWWGIMPWAKVMSASLKSPFVASRNDAQFLFRGARSPRGAQSGNRTHDLRITNALLYRLSYLGAQCAAGEVSGRPAGRGRSTSPMMRRARSVRTALRRTSSRRGCDGSPRRGRASNRQTIAPRPTSPTG